MFSKISLLQVYKQYCASKYCGLYELHTPILLVWDLDLLKSILVKDFDHFVDRRTVSTKSESVLNEILSLKTGSEWKILRAIMSPTFTSGKMRGMFSLVCDKADALVSFCLADIIKNPYTDMKNNCGRYTMDTIACCAFGIECNSFVNENAEFAKRAESFFTMTPKVVLKTTLLMTAPKVFDALKLEPDTSDTKFFANAAKETLVARLKGQKRGDFLDLMLVARTENSDLTGNTTTGNIPSTSLYSLLHRSDKESTFMKCVSANLFTTILQTTVRTLPL